MNDNHSIDGLAYKPRWIEPLFASALVDFPVVVLTGARQTGKSTFLRHARPVNAWRYLTLDDYDTRHAADTHPESLWTGARQVVIDEVQHSPRLLSAVKMAVDKDRKLRFVLSGSANLLLMRRIVESLAGRAVYFTLLPMTLGEMQGQTPPGLLSELIRGELPPPRKPVTSAFPLPALLVKGSMPPLLSLSADQSVARWWEGYISTYLERDLREISQIDSLVDFRRVMVALALRNGRMLNQTEVSRDTGVSQPTIHRYVNLLETTGLAERLPAYAVNRTKRLIKAPKFYWTDSGLAAFLSGYHSPAELEKNLDSGPLFETLVLLHLKALCELMTPKPRLYYWRTTTGHEVDFVIEQGRNLTAVEVKYTATPRFGDTDNLRLFLEEYPKTNMGVLIYNGRELRQMGEKIIALPWTALAGKSS